MSDQGDAPFPVGPTATQEQARLERVFAEWMAPFVGAPAPALAPVPGLTSDLFAGL